MSGDIFATLVDTIAARINPSRRFLIAIAGPPGAGKSTLAERLAAALNEKFTHAPAIVVPMDGFHYDDGVLIARGLRERKGAPDTFDADGFRALLTRLKSETGPIAIPVFDRALEISRGSARIVEPHHSILIIEGNYLLLDQPVWRDLKPLFDLSIALRPDFQLIEQRLIKRWLDHGFPRAEAEHKARGNDLVNATRVLNESVAADITINNDV